MKANCKYTGVAMRVAAILFTIHYSLFTATAQESLSLAGAWDFAVGDSAKYDDYVMLPGSMLTNGKGDPVTVDTRWTGSLYDSSYFFNPYMEKYRVEGQMKFPFFLTPERHYVGKAWYRKTVYVPETWKDRRVVLFLERPHIETTVYVNGRNAGHQLSLSTPHEYDVTKLLVPGRRNTIAICVDNSIDNVCVGQDSHSVTDQTQGNWNGIVGTMELRSMPEQWYIDKVRLTPVVRRGVLHVEVTLGGYPNYFVYQVPEMVVAIERVDSAQLISLNYVDADSPQISLDYRLGSDMALWSEFSPQLYRIAIELGDSYYETTFGMRDIAVYDRQFYLNGSPIWLRGTVENCCFPETGYPPMDEESWLRIFRKCKEYGLNHMRFHSYCPPEAAFAASDKVGFYLQPEGPSWPNHGVKLRRGQKIDQYLIEESKRIIDTYGHHPSFVMMAAGNEPAGDWVGYCNDWVKEMKRYDPSKVYCGASVGGGWAWDDGSEYHVKGGARGLDWDKRAPQSVDDYYSQIEYPRNYRDTVPNNSPIIAHEQGQWCAFPDFKEIPQYTGAYKARNFEIFRDLLRDNGMESQAENFLMASGKLQTLCYKYEIERNLRTKDYAGFQLLALNDYSGQGTALEGVLNVHWREKGYTTARDWYGFCAPVVSLARFPKFVYANSDTLRVPVEAYNAMYGTIDSVRTTYFITDDSMKVYAGGLLSMRDIPMGKNHPLGTIVFPLDTIKEARKLTLTVKIGRRLKNHWDFWVYPEEKKEMRNEKLGMRNDDYLASPDTADDSANGTANNTANSTANRSNHNSSFLIPHSSFLIPHSSVYIADTLDAKALAVLKKGGKVLLTAAGKVKLGSDVVQHYLPVFWNTSWFKMRPPHTTGAYIDKSHPLFKYDFPTDSWSNLNWWELLNRAQVMNLMELPASYQPPIQPIDTWHVSRKLGMLIEANVLKGRLLMTTMDIDSDLDHRLVARQMRQAILRYMESDDFRPTITLQPQTITDFFTKQGPKVSMFTKDSPDELKPKLTASH